MEGRVNQIYVYTFSGRYAEPLKLCWYFFLVLYLLSESVVGSGVVDSCARPHFDVTFKWRVLPSL